MKWTKEYRAAYMRAYREKHREWLRVTYAIWYKANRKARNARRRKVYAALAPGRRQANGLHLSSPERGSRVPDGPQTQSGQVKHCTAEARPTIPQRQGDLTK